MGDGDGFPPTKESRSQQIDRDDAQGEHDDRHGGASRHHHALASDHQGLGSTALPSTVADRRVGRQGGCARCLRASCTFVVLTRYRARMASSVARLFASAGLTWHSVTPWGTLPRLSAPGLYVVSTSADPSAVDAPSTRRLSDARIDDLLTVRPEMMVGGLPADARRLAEALLAMWPEGETVLYIGPIARTGSDCTHGRR